MPVAERLECEHLRVGVRQPKARLQIGDDAPVVGGPSGGEPGT
jgi:hypothetical protein